MITMTITITDLFYIAFQCKSPDMEDDLWPRTTFNVWNVPTTLLTWTISWNICYFDGRFCYFDGLFAILMNSLLF